MTLNEMKKVAVVVVSKPENWSYYLRDFTGRIFLLEKSGVLKKFRSLFNIPIGGFSTYGELKYNKSGIWFNKLITNKNEYAGYLKWLGIIIKKFGFKESELFLLEDYLQMGGPIVAGIGSSDQEMSKGWLTRNWEGVSLARRILQMEEKNKSFKEIATYLHDILQKSGVNINVSEVKLRQISSRAQARLIKSEAIEN